MHDAKHALVIDWNTNFVHLTRKTSDCVERISSHEFPKHQLDQQLRVIIEFDVSRAANVSVMKVWVRSFLGPVLHEATRHAVFCNYHRLRQH
jgi:hypothetical protein